MYKTFDKTETEVIILGELIVMIYQTKIKTVLLPNLGDFINNINSDNPTRTTDKSSTLLDHFATNKPNFIILSGSRSIGFSDHDLVFGIRKISGSMQEEPKIVNCRNTKHYTPKIFRKALSEASWGHILTAMDPNTMSELWLDQFTDILDQIAPFKQRKVKNCYAPYIDKDFYKKNMPNSKTQVIGQHIKNLEMKLIPK